MSKTHERLERLERDKDYYRAEYECLIRGLATLRDSSAFVIANDGELALVASDPGEVVVSAARQLAELRAENARIRALLACALERVDAEDEASANGDESTLAADIRAVVEGGEA